MNSLVLRGGAVAQAALVGDGQAPNDQVDNATGETEDISDVPTISILRREHRSFCEDQSEILIQESDENFSET